jgi:hypothetical protein
MLFLDAIAAAVQNHSDLFDCALIEESGEK